MGGLVDASADIMPEIERRVRLAWERCRRFKRELYDTETTPITLTVRMLKAEVMEPVRNMDPRQGALCSAANGTPQVSPTDHWLPMSTTHRPFFAVHQVP